MGVVEEAGDLGRLDEGATRLLGVARAGLGLAEGLQEGDAAVAAGALESLQRSLVHGGGLVVGELAHGAVAGPARVVDPALGAVEGSGLEEMVGELGEPRVDPVAGELLEGLAHVAVESDAPAGLEAVVEGGLDQGVAEGELLRRFRHGMHQPDLPRRLDQPEQLVTGFAGGRGEGGDAEAVADDRRDAEDLLGLFGKRRKALRDRLPNALGQGESGGGCSLAVAEAILGVEEGHQLAHEQRVAAGELAEVLDELVGRTALAHLLDETADAFGFQTRQRDTPAPAQEIRGQRRPLPLEVHLGVAIGREKQDGQVLEGAGDEAEGLQGGLVGPMEVVDDDDEGCVSRGEPKQLDQGVVGEEAALVGGRLLARGLGPVGELGHDLGEVCRLRSEFGQQIFLLWVLAYESANDLNPGPIGRRGPARPTDAPGGMGATRLGLVRQGSREARLADPGLPGEQHDGAMAGDRLLESGGQLSQLPLAPNQGPTSVTVARNPSR